MRFLDDYRVKASELSKERFLALFGAPVFVPTEIFSGSIKRQHTKARNATMMHFDRTGIVNPLRTNRAMTLGSKAPKSIRHGLMIGRDSGCAVVIADYTISKRHALWTPGKFPRPATLEDQGSSNGTWINGTRLEKGSPQPLESRDTVRFGRMVLTYLSGVDFYQELVSGTV